MDFLHSILGPDLGAAGLVILNLVLIESLLSIDNAAVLATMVLDLPKEQRGKALRYGLIGAYVFRGICLLFASFLIKVWWLKIIGGAYLLWLFIQHFTKKQSNVLKGIEEEIEEDKIIIEKEKKWLTRITGGAISTFWMTIISIEIMDLAFSIDNVFAAVAFTDNLTLIMLGVFIGILSMRFVAQGFVKVLEKYPFLDDMAFIVIGVLGLKLCMALPEHMYPNAPWVKFLTSETFDLILSLFTVALFVIPVLTSRYFNFPKHG
jgi:YkoY family integral membrane protein